MLKDRGIPIRQNINEILSLFLFSARILTGQSIAYCYYSCSLVVVVVVVVVVVY